MWNWPEIAASGLGIDASTRSHRGVRHFTGSRIAAG
jgi:hypothetical protein